METRISNLRKILLRNNLPPIFISNIADVRYLSGFTGSTAYMIVSDTDVKFFTDGRYETQSADQVPPSIERHIIQSYRDVFVKECSKYNKLLLQSECSVGVSSIIMSSGVEVVVDDKDILKTMRMVKSTDEISLIKAQYTLAAKAFMKSLSDFKVGDTERDWAAMLEFNIKKGGANGVSFETIVASGFRGAMPHGTASDKIIDELDPVIIDFGSEKGYTSDYTRMVYGGKDKDVLNIIDIVRDALLMAIDGVRPGIACKELDNIAREHIGSKGFGDYFNHSLGHGVGLDVHELPVLNKTSNMVAEEGMVFTIEPGIYLPNRFGVRLEDTVLVTSYGSEIISKNLSRYVYKPF